MRLKWHVCACAAVCLFVLTGAALAEEELFVQSARAKMMSGPSFESAVVKELSKGTGVLVQGRSGNWIRVSAAGADGYVFSFVLGKTPPLGQKTALADIPATAKESSRHRSSVKTTAVAGVRGLTQEGRNRLSKDEKVNYDALDKIESIQFSDTEVDGFVKEGGL